MSICSSRKGACDTALHLLNTTCNKFLPGRISAYVADAHQQEQLRQASSQMIDKQLQRVVQAGIGFHNAAVEAQDRNLVEQLFRASMLQVRWLISERAQVKQGSSRTWLRTSSDDKALHLSRDL